MYEARNEVDDVHDEAKCEPRHPQQPKHGGLHTKNVFFFVVVGLWSQWTDKLTIHLIPCSWIL